MWWLVGVSLCCRRGFENVEIEENPDDAALEVVLVAVVVVLVNSGTGLTMP